MKKSLKIILLSLVLLISLSFVSATDVNNTQQEVISDTPAEVQQTITDIGTDETEQTNEETQTCCCSCNYTPRTYNNHTTINSSNYADKIGEIYNYEAVEFEGTIDSTITGGSLTITNPIVITSTSGATFEDMQFIINSNDVTISNLNIVNDDETSGAVITSTGYNNTEIINNTITVTKTTAGETFGIKVTNSNNTTVCKNTVSVSALPQSMGWEYSGGEWVGAVQVSGILYSNVNNSKIKCNNVTVNASTSYTPFGWSTADGITVKGGSQNVIIGCNNVNVTGSEYNYGISLSEFVNNITIKNNTITMATTNQLCGIQLSTTTNSTVKGNKIYGNCTAVAGTTASCEAFAYGIVVSTGTYGSSDSEAYNNMIEDNEITLNSTVAYGIELNNADYNNVTNNTVNVTGKVVMDLGIYNSSYVNIIDNTFYSTGNTTSLNTGIYEAIYPVTTGIKINQTSNNILIEDNTIIVIDNANGITSYAVILEDCNDSTVEYNNITVNQQNPSPEDYDDLVLNNGENNTIYNP